MERACRPLCGLQAGAASREDEDRLLQGCEPARRFPEPIVRLSRVQIPSEKSVGKRASCLCVLSARATTTWAAARAVCRTLSLTRSERRVLGADLNRSESRQSR